MKFLLTMNQIAYFKPETTARRLRNYYYQGEGNPVIFLGYLRLIRHLPQLAERAKPLQPQLYRKEVRAIFLETHWESSPTCWLQLFLREFREFFTPEEWRILQLRYQALHPFLGWQLVGYLKKAQQLQVVSQLVSLTLPSPHKKTVKQLC